MLSLFLISLCLAVVAGVSGGVFHVMLLCRRDLSCPAPLVWQTRQVRDLCWIASGVFGAFALWLFMALVLLSWH